MYGRTGLIGDEWPRSNRMGEFKRWTDEANRSDERLRFYHVSEVKRWTTEILSQGKETCGNEGVGF